MKFKILNSGERDEVLSSLKEQFGVEESLRLVFLLQENKRKLYVVNEDVVPFLDEFKVNRTGVYFGKYYEGVGVRLSLDGSQIVGPLASKNVFELEDGDVSDWMNGRKIPLSGEEQRRGFQIVKNGSDFLGCGKVIDEELKPYVPKNRRLNS